MATIGSEIIRLKEVGSTNSFLMEQRSREKLKEGTVVIADYQTAGRGTDGSKWESGQGQNLTFSFILYPTFLAPEAQFYLNKTISLGLSDLVRELLPKRDNIHIKWPNDIYVQNKKVAGILIENSVKGKYLSSAIVGIGLNLNQVKFVSDAPNPVSLKQNTRKDYNVETVAGVISEYINIWYKKLQIGSFKEIDSTYFQQLYRTNEWAMFSKQGQYFEAKIVEIGEFGQLILEDRNGVFSEYMFKEVEFVI